MHVERGEGHVPRGPARQQALDADRVAAPAGQRKSDRFAGPGDARGRSLGHEAGPGLEPPPRREGRGGAEDEDDRNDRRDRAAREKPSAAGDEGDVRCGAGRQHEPLRANPAAQDDRQHDGGGTPGEDPGAPAPAPRQRGGKEQGQRRHAGKRPAVRQHEAKTGGTVDRGRNGHDQLDESAGRGGGDQAGRERPPISLPLEPEGGRSAERQQDHREELARDQRLVVAAGECHGGSLDRRRGVERQRQERRPVRGGDLAPALPRDGDPEEREDDGRNDQGLGDEAGRRREYRDDGRAQQQARHRAAQETPLIVVGHPLTVLRQFVRLAAIITNTAPNRECARIRRPAGASQRIEG